MDRAYTHYIERLGKKPGPMLNDYAEMISRHTVHVAESAERIIGVLVLINKEDGLLLDNIAVDPDSQGLGLGAQLMALAEREARVSGTDNIYLYTHEKMLENIPYYQKRGYTEYERKTVQGYSRIYMRKQLTEKN